MVMNPLFLLPLLKQFAVWVPTLIKGVDVAIKSRTLIPGSWTRAAAKESQWVELNVGGCHYLTTRKTLLAVPMSLFSHVFRQQSGASDGSDDILFMSERDYKLMQLKMVGGDPVSLRIDRDGECFRVILNYLRTGHVVLDHRCTLEGVLREAEFFDLPALVEHIERGQFSESHHRSSSSLAKQRIIEQDDSDDLLSLS
jgi:BTB/POZ domain